MSEGGRCGPRFTALVASMKGACHASFRTIRKFLRDVVVEVQFCLAHVIRDVKYLLTPLPDAETRAYGERLRDDLRRLFEVFHRKKEWSPAVLQHSLEVVRDHILVTATTDVSSTSKAQNMAKRFTTHGKSFCTNSPDLGHPGNHFQTSRNSSDIFR